MKIIELKCRCGAEFKYEDNKDEWAKNRDVFGFAVEEMANRWLTAHRECTPKPLEVEQPK